MSKPSLNVAIRTRTGIGQWSEPVGYLTRFESAHFELVANGGYGTATLGILQEFNQDGFIALASKNIKRLDFIVNGTPMFFALLRRPVRIWEEIQVHNIQGLGPVDEMNKTMVQKIYVPPSGAQDLSWFYLALAQDYILKRGFANRVSVEVIGVTVQSIAYNGNLRQCLTDLGTLGENYVHWGLRLETDGAITFYVRKRNDEASPDFMADVAQNDYDFTTDKYGPVVTHLDHTDEDEDLVNTLIITGGDLKYPNMIPVNPSFEELQQGANESANMLKNGNFDESNAGAWSLGGGASIKDEAEDPSHTTPNHLELDHTGETASQHIVGIVGTFVYGLNWQQAVENPSLAGYTILARITWFNPSGELLSVTEASFNVTGAIWDGRTIKAQAPDTCTSATVLFQPTALPGGGGSERGIKIDSAIFFPNNVYQKGWRIETTSTPRGSDTNGANANLYWIDWLHDYDDPTHIRPGNDLGFWGSYCILLEVYGKTGSTYVRLMGSSENVLQVAEKQFYTIQITARSTMIDGSDPSIVNPTTKTLRLGIVWWGDDPNAPQNKTVVEVVLSSNWKTYGLQFQMPTHAKTARVYFETLANGLYFFDGAYFGQNPAVPDYFNPTEKFQTIINVKDVFDSTDPNYTANDDPPTGYGAMEETYENPSVLTRSDAVIAARPVFKRRALPLSSEVINIVQTDAPLTYYSSGAYFQAIGRGALAGYPFPKLWIERATWDYVSAGWAIQLELTKELPRVEQIIARDRALVITAVGTGADSLDTYIPPINQLYTVVADDLPGGSDPKVTIDVDGIQALTLSLDAEADSPASMEISMNGFDLPQSALSLIRGIDGNRTLIITLSSGYTFDTDDEFVIWYRTTGTKFYAARHFYTVATTGGSEIFQVMNATGLIPVTPLIDTWRVYVRKRRVPSDKFTVLLDPITGNPDHFQFDSSIGLAAGDEIAVRYDAPDLVVRGIYNREGILDSSGSIAVGDLWIWNDLTYAAFLEISGMAQSNPVITQVGSDLFMAVPTDRVGDRYLIRENWK